MLMPFRTGAGAEPGNPAAVGMDVLGYGAIGDGVADDTAAFQHALDALGTTPHSDRSLYVPGGRTYLIKGSLTLEMDSGEPVSLHSSGMNGARLLVPGGYKGTLLTVAMHGGNPTGPGFSFAMENLTFLHGGTDTGGTAIAITTAGGGAMMPSVSTTRTVFAGSGSFATGLLLNGDNITTLSDTYWAGLPRHLREV